MHPPSSAALTHCDGGPAPFSPSPAVVQGAHAAREPFDRLLTAELIAGSECVVLDTGRSRRAGLAIQQALQSGSYPRHSVTECHIQDIWRLSAAVRARCPLDGRAEDGWTGLMLVSYEGHVDIVNALILADASIDIQDAQGSIGLISASCKGHAAVVNALILADASIDIRDEWGWTALINVGIVQWTRRGQGRIEVQSIRQ